MSRNGCSGIVAAMPTTSALTTASAAGLRKQLELLQREKAFAALTGLGTNDIYMADLTREIAATRAAYIGAAVTEIASLRADIDGALFG